MKRSRLIAVLSLLTAFAAALLAGLTVREATLPSQAAADAEDGAPPLPDFNSNSDFSPSLPLEWTTDMELAKADHKGQLDATRKRRLMDMYSWREFVALQWPLIWRQQDAGIQSPNYGCALPGQDFAVDQPGWIADKSQFPGAGATTEIGDGYVPRWQVWSDNDRGFLFPGFKTRLTDFEQPGSAEPSTPALENPLIDQHRRRVLYQVVINPTEEKYLKDHFTGQMRTSLVLSGAQSAMTNCPDGVDCDKYNCPGVLELKLAWKVLAHGDIRGRFLRRKVQLPIGCSTEANCNVDCSRHPAKCSSVELGLVGMHIIHKTKLQEQWIWSTFEQVDNVRSNKLPRSGQTRPSFFDPNCPSAKCPINRPGAPGHSSQIMRECPIPNITEELNSKAQSLVARQDSVLQYYELVGTQYLANVSGELIPPTLRNTVIEPFATGETSSCIGCHRGAVISPSCQALAEHTNPSSSAYGDYRTAPEDSADFSFVIGDLRCGSQDRTATR